MKYTEVVLSLSCGRSFLMSVQRSHTHVLDNTYFPCCNIPQILKYCTAFCFILFYSISFVWVVLDQACLPNTAEALMWFTLPRASPFLLPCILLEPLFSFKYMVHVVYLPARNLRPWALFCWYIYMIRRTQVPCLLLTSDLFLIFR